MSFQFKIVKDEPVNKEVEVITSTDRIDSATDNIAEEIREKANVDGFRKGKVPLSVIKSKFKSAILAEGMKKIISDAVGEILKEKNWQLATIKDIDVDKDDPSKFTLKFEILPDFELAEYKGIELVAEDEIKEEQLLAAKLNELRETKAKIQVIDRPAKVGDLLVIDLKTPRDKVENSMIELGNRSLPDEMNKIMVGTKKDDAKEFEVKVEDDKTENWHIKIKEVKEKIVPTDDELARQLGFTTVDEMKEELKDEVEEDLKRLNRSRQKDKLANYLVERNKFLLPEGLIEQEYKYVIAERKEEDTTSNRERFMKVAEDRVRLTMIINKIAQKEDITVRDEEVDKYLSTYGTGLQYNDKQINELKNNENVRGSIITMMLRDRVLDLILDNSQVVKKERIVSPWSKDDNSTVRNRANR